MSHAPAAPVPADDNQLIAERREKLAQIRAQGVAFPNDFKPRDHAADLHAAADGKDNAALEAAPITACVAGRMMLKRVMGKACFATLQDGSPAGHGRIQLYVTQDNVGAETLAAFKHWDLGDILGAEGTLFRTKTGELSIKVTSIRLLTKALRPLPDKFHGMTDQEQKYRQRYVDLITDEASRTRFRARSKAVSGIRQFMIEHGFLEVETPMLHPIPGGANARPFVTHHNALDRDLYLRIATELYLKRCIVGGLEKVYELGKDFRNEGVSHKHNPEFTMVETYEAFADYRDVMDMLEQLVSTVAREAVGGTTVAWKGEEIDLAPPWRRVAFRDALRESSGIDIREHADADSLRAAMRAAGLEAPDGIPWAKLVDGILSQSLEPTLIQPTILFDYPLELSPFAKRTADDPGTVERFEAFAGGMEIANAFTELNDPDDQRARFAMAAADRAAGDDEAQPMDEDFLAALEHGMPPTGGLGLGIDRLVMLLTDRHTIREVILFPAMRT